MKYRVLWLLEIVLGALLLFVVFVPIQDYALREYKEYLRHPSPETLKAFQDKNHQEFQLRLGVAILSAAAGLAVATPIFRIRNRNKARQTGQ